MDTKFYNEDYERVILGILLMDNSLIDIISGKLPAEAFYNGKNKFIYETILKQWKENNCVNIMTLATDLNKIDPSELAALTDLVASSSTWEVYVKGVSECYLTRKLKKEVSTMLQTLTPSNVNETVSGLESKLSSYLQYGGGNGEEIKNLCLTVPEEIQTNWKNKVEYLGYETGFEELDDILDGFQTKNLYVIGARPSIGKTAFLLALLKALCSRGHGVSFLSLEMSAKSCFYRMLASESGLPMWQIRKGFCMEFKSGLIRLRSAFEKLFNYDMNIIDTDVDNENVLYSRIRYEAKVKGKKIIAIDHLGLVEVAESTGQRYVDVGKITKTLHKMCKELDICIILLCQCGRAAEGNKPNMSLLRESGNIEQDADVIMFLHRERDTEQDRIPTECIVAKNRDGKTGTANFIFNVSCQDFSQDKKLKDYTKAPVIPVKEADSEEIPY